MTTAELPLNTAPSQRGWRRWLHHLRSPSLNKSWQHASQAHVCGVRTLGNLSADFGIRD